MAAAKISRIETGESWRNIRQNLRTSAKMAGNNVAVAKATAPSKSWKWRSGGENLKMWRQAGINNKMKAWRLMVMKMKEEGKRSGENGSEEMNGWP